MILGIGAVGTIILFIFYILRKFGRCGNQFPTTSYTLTGKRALSVIYTTFAFLVVFSCFCGIVFSIMYVAGAGMLITTAFNVVTATVNTFQNGSATLSGTSVLIDSFAANFAGMSNSIATSAQTAQQTVNTVTNLNYYYGNISQDINIGNIRNNIINPIINTNNLILQLTTNTGFHFNSSNPLGVILPLDLNTRYPLSPSVDLVAYGMYDHPTDPAIDAMYGYAGNTQLSLKTIDTRVSDATGDLQNAEALTAGTINDIVNVYVAFRNGLNRTAGTTFELSNLQQYLTSGGVEAGYQILLAFFALFLILGFLGVGIAYVVFGICGALRNGRATKVSACCSFSLIFWAFVYAASCLFVFMIFSPYCVYQTELLNPSRLSTDFQANYPNFTSALNFTYGLVTCSGKTTILDALSRTTSGPPINQQADAFFQAINQSIYYTVEIGNDTTYSLAIYQSIVTNTTANNLIKGQNNLLVTMAALQSLFALPPAPISTITPVPTTAAPTNPNVTTTAMPSSTPSPTPTSAPGSYNFTTMVALLGYVNDFGNYYNDLNIYEYDSLIGQIDHYTNNLTIKTTSGNETVVSVFFTRANVSLFSMNVYPFNQSANPNVTVQLQNLYNQVHPMTGTYQNIVNFQSNFTSLFLTLQTQVNTTVFSTAALNDMAGIEVQYSQLGSLLNTLNSQIQSIYPWEQPLQANAEGLFTFINMLAGASCASIGQSMNTVNYEICSVMNTATVFIGLCSFFVGLFCFLLYPIALMAAKRFTGNTVDDDIDSLSRRADALAARSTGRLRLRV